MSASVSIALCVCNCNPTCIFTILQVSMCLVIYPPATRWLCSLPYQWPIWTPGLHFLIIHTHSHDTCSPLTNHFPKCILVSPHSCGFQVIFTCLYLSVCWFCILCLEVLDFRYGPWTVGCVTASWFWLCMFLLVYLLLSLTGFSAVGLSTLS